MEEAAECGPNREEVEGAIRPCLITICESAPDGFALSPDVLKLADNQYILPNCGPYTRYVPAFNYHCDFTLLMDDDLLLGRRIVEHFVHWAEQKPDASLLGQMGRIVKDRYEWREVAGSATDFTPVGMVVRAYFVRTAQLYTLKLFRQAWGKPIIEDDMALTWGIHMFTAGGIFLTPDSRDAEEKVIAEELPSPLAISQLPNHLRIRNEAWQEAKALSARVTKENLKSRAAAKEPDADRVEERLVFGISVHKESAEQVASCLEQLRRVYPGVQGFMIGDGTDDERYRNLCASRRFDYIAGERLKLLGQRANGGSGSST